LKSKKRKIKTDQETLLNAADNYAEEAEHRHKITLIAKSDAMRKVAKEKDLELKAIEQQLNEKPWLYLVSFLRYSMSKNIVTLTLKLGSKVTHGH